MTTIKLQKWGNSKGVRIPNDALKQLGVSDLENVEFEISVINNSLFLEPVKQETFIDKLFKNYKPEKTKSDFNWDDFDKPVGNEMF